MRVPISGEACAYAALSDCRQSHDQEIVRWTRNASGGLFAPTSVGHGLSNMEEKGHAIPVTPDVFPFRRGPKGTYYELTEAGRLFAEELRNVILAIYGAGEVEADEVVEPFDSLHVSTFALLMEALRENEPRYSREISNWTDRVTGGRMRVERHALAYQLKRSVRTGYIFTPSSVPDRRGNVGRYYKRMKLGRRVAPAIRRGVLRMYGDEVA